MRKLILLFTVLLIVIVSMQTYSQIMYPVVTTVAVGDIDSFRVGSANRYAFHIFVGDSISAAEFKVWGAPNDMLDRWTNVDPNDTTFSFTPVVNDRGLTITGEASHPWLKLSLQSITKEDSTRSGTAADSTIYVYFQQIDLQ